MTKTTTTPLGRAEQKELTRQRLIETTIDLIATEGFSNTTLSKVANSSGYSQGLVNFHFKSKDQLLLDALNQMNEQFIDIWKTAIKKGGTTQDKIIQLVHALFDTRITNSKEAAVWAGFWGEARARRAYTALLTEKDDDLVQQVSDLLTALKTEGNYQTNIPLVATALSTLIHGYDLVLLLSPQDYKQDDAIQSCFDYLSAYFPNHFQQGIKPEKSTNKLSPLN